MVDPIIPAVRRGRTILEAVVGSLSRWERDASAHHAGVSEQPWDPDGLTSADITQLVESKCKL